MKGEFIMIVMIDNYDSFVYNLYQYIGELNSNIIVVRNDRTTINKLKNIDISHIIISPGPGFPCNAGISEEVIKTFGKCIPILGVCLGHQAIAETYGAKIVHAEKILHGKASLIKHNGCGLFNEVKNPLKVIRYHSLIVDKESMPDCLEVTAVTEEGEIMGIRHKEYPVFGLQFHPESICTESGKQIIKNFLNIKIVNKEEEFAC